MITDMTPHELLKPYISKYSFINLSTTYAPEQYVPDGAVKIFIYERDDCIRYHSDTGNNPNWKDGVVANLSPGYSMEVHRPIRLTICCFKAAAFYQLFRIPVHLLHDDFIPLEEIIGGHSRTLKDVLANTDTVQAKKAVLDRFFLHLLTKCNHLFGQNGIAAIEQLILCQSGNIKLDSLSQQTNLSMRSVERHFWEYIGMPPKQFCKIIRFNAAFLLYKYHPCISWQEIVYRCGYYDQSHYISEFRSFMGVSPGKYSTGNDCMSSIYVGSHMEHVTVL